MKTLHLKKDLGLNKQVLQKQCKEAFSYLSEDELEERGFNKLKNLLDKRTQKYSIKDSIYLASSYLTSHDWCVLDSIGFEEFSAVEEYQAEKKYFRMEKAIEIATKYKKEYDTTS